MSRRKWPNQRRRRLCWQFFDATDFCWDVWMLMVGITPSWNRVFKMAKAGDFWIFQSGKWPRSFRLSDLLPSGHETWPAGKSTSTSSMIFSWKCEFGSWIFPRLSSQVVDPVATWFSRGPNGCIKVDKVGTPQDILCPRRRLPCSRCRLHRHWRRLVLVYTA